MFKISVSLQTTGEATEVQLMESLRRYGSRLVYVRRTLYELFSRTQEFTKPRVDLIKVNTIIARNHYVKIWSLDVRRLVELTLSVVSYLQLILPVMKNHPMDIAVQMAATACFYNLLKHDLSAAIHPRWLCEVVHLTLDAMQNHHRHQQVGAPEPADLGVDGGIL